MAKVVQLHKARGGALHTATSYNFVDKAPYVDELRTWVQQSGMTYDDIAIRAGISKSTVANLFSGKTVRPQARTVSALGGVFGKRLSWVDI